MHLLDWDRMDEVLVYNDRVIPYDLNTPLFTDYALKARALYVPEGETIAYDPDRPFDFPVGSALVKTFYYPADFRRPDEDLTLIETRVLIHTPEGWESWPYIWNDAQTDAELALGGQTREVSFVDPAGVTQTTGYLVPQRNQCRQCHERNIGPGGEAAQGPIGPAARHMNRDYEYGDAGVQNQLAYLTELGMLSGLPDLGGVPTTFAFAPVEAGGLDALPPEELDHAARSYLDINCAHCHDPLGTIGATSQLFLNHDSVDEFRLGVCKMPGSAGLGTGGLSWDIVPGNADESIMVFRLETTTPGAMMPLLGRSLEHERGAALVRAWVDAMAPMDCGAP